MSAYTIMLLKEDGQINELLNMAFDSDDAAIDHVGSIPHPYAMIVRQGDRDVARFPALANTPRTFFGDPGGSES